MGIFNFLFGKKKKTTKVNFDALELNLTETGKESIIKFTNRTDRERMRDIMMLGDKGDPNFFYLIYYAALFDTDLDVRFSALKNPKF